METPQRTAFWIAYEGADFAGWQRQPQAKTVQGEMERALGIVLQAPISLLGASRTDAGVHARYQVAHMEGTPRSPPHRLVHSLNSLLPSSIRCYGVASVPADFHAQLSAEGKEYRYRLQLGAVADPLHRHWAWHWPGSLDLERLSAVLRLFEGTHDFAAFANKGGAPWGARGAVRTVWDMHLPEAGDSTLLCISCSGDGFLYKMVRNLVSAAVRCAAGELSPEQLHALWQGGDRRALPPPAPAHGLCLERVMYSQEIAWER